VTRVLVSRHPGGHPGHDPGGHHGHNPGGPSGDHQHHAAAGAEVGPLAGAQSQAEGLEGLLRVAMARLPPILGGAPSQPLEVGRASRVVTPPNAAPWPSATAAVCSPTASGPWPGARVITWSTGPMAAPPTLRTWPWCVGRIIGRSMRGAGG
jgi:hypothetical protein